jgi:heme/copper-type cytochrome/quinol oxidase subunit 3
MSVNASPKKQKQFVIDVSDFSRHVTHKDAPFWWGIIGLILIELSVVAAFVVSYFYLQMMNDPWPPLDFPLIDMRIPTIELAILLLSCITMYLAGKAIDNNRVKRFVVYTFLSVAMASIVLWLRWHHMDAFEIGWDQHVYGSLLWTITGFHFLHVVSAAIGTAVIGCFGIAGFFNTQRQLGVVVDTLYWNFVAVAWLPFYGVLYWAPRLL